MDTRIACDAEVGVNGREHGGARMPTALVYAQDDIKVSPIDDFLAGIRVSKKIDKWFMGEFRRWSARRYGKRNDAFRLHVMRYLGVDIGKYSYGYEQIMRNVAQIGAFCSIADGVTVTVAEHPTHLISTSPAFYLPKFGLLKGASEFSERNIRNFGAPTIIGHDVWIGHGATILNGLEIGIGAVIGAGAVVTRNVPPYAVVCGVPGRIIRYRFSEERRAELLQSEWWMRTDDELRHKIGEFHIAADRSIGAQRR